MAAAAAAAAFSTISWLEAAAAKSDNVCAAELFDEVRLKAPESNKILDENEKLYLRANTIAKKTFVLVNATGRLMKEIKNLKAYKI